MKRIFALLLFVISSLISFSQVRISQVYGGGGNAGATYNQDFVELFNAGSTSVSIGGWSIQYASAAGTTWAVNALPASYSLAPGQYFLMALASGATGVALPTPDGTGTSNMSGTSGKVALVNNTTALSGASACSSASVVDVLGFGAGSCFETAVFPATGITTAQAMFRLAAGCTDNNNNSTDFTLLSVAPRNSGSALNPCGGPTPTIIVSPSNLTITTTTGVASSSSTFTLSASNLTPAAGNLSITPTAGLEFSFDNSTFFSAVQNIAYTAGTLPNTTIYTRIAASAAQGTFTGSITCAGGGASTNGVVNVSGGVIQNYYNTKANTGLTNLGTWSTTTDGSGPSPANFSAAYQYFNIISQANANYSGVWDVSNTGNTSRVVVGNGTAALTFTVLPGIDSVTSATRIDILNNATLVLQNNRRPFLNNIATGSTVDFAQSGLTTADTIKVPALSYHNLKLTGGIKILASGTITVRGNWVVDNVINFNGSPTPFSTLNAFGDVTFQNGSTFEPVATGDGNRITLAMNGNSGSQTISGSGTDLLLFRLRRDTTTSDDDITIGPNTNITLGNSAGGGLQLTQGAATTTNMIIDGTNRIRFIKAAASTATSLGTISALGGRVYIEKSAGTANAGTLRFAGTSRLDSLVINFDPAFTRDSITLATDVIIADHLNLTKGKIIMTNPAALILPDTINIVGGSSSSFVDGKIKWNTASTSAHAFPVGKGSSYRPVSVTPVAATASSYTAEYFSGPYSTLTFTAPLTGISNTEYWDVAKVSGANATVSLSLSGTAVTGATASDQVVVAHFETGNWVSVNGTGITPGNATTGTAVSSVLSTFSPFTFGITAGATTYTFNGNGNWSNPANWVGGLIPPLTLTAPNIIVINPISGGECVVDVVNQHVSLGAQFIISPGANIRIPSNLFIQ